MGPAVCRLLLSDLLGHESHAGGLKLRGHACAFERAESAVRVMVLLRFARFRHTLGCLRGEGAS